MFSSRQGRLHDQENELIFRTRALFESTEMNRKGQGKEKKEAELLGFIMQLHGLH